MGLESGRRRWPDEGAQNMSTRVPTTFHKEGLMGEIVLKATFDQIGRYSLATIHRIRWNTGFASAL